MKNNLLSSKNKFLTSLFVMMSFLFTAPVMALNSGTDGDPCNTSQPRPITGPENPCAGSLVTYCIENDRGYTSFVWDVPRAQAGNPPTGWVIVSGQGTECVTVMVGTKSGTMKVTVTDPICGTKVATLPVNPGAGLDVDLNGPETICLFSDDPFTYTATNIAGATYAWSINNASISSGQGTNSVEVIADVDAGPGSITVVVTTGCGSKSTTLNFDVVEDCDLITPLPVELISFTGAASSEGVALNWATASEKNNDRFEIERSADGRSFEKVATVKGNGTSNVKNAYNFLDKTPMAGLNYYRLRQVDLNGTTEFSKTIAIDSRKVTDNPVTLYPNPVTDGNFNIRMKATGQPVSIQIMDISGRMINSQTITNNGEVSIDGKALGMKPGIYLINVKAGNAVTVQKLMMK